MAQRTSDRTEGFGAGFEALVAEHSPSLYRFAWTMVRDHQSAEDLVQDTFLRAYEKRNTFRGEASIGTWLHRILHNLAINRARRPNREVLVEDIDEKWKDDAYTVDSAAVVERAETREELEDALVQLPYIYRSAVVLHDVEDWTMKQIALVQQLGLPAAKQRLRRGRMMLVTALASGAERRAKLRGIPLRCWDARKRVSDYLDGELTAEQRTLVERHLESCPTCPPLYASLVGVHERLGDLRDPDTVVPPGLADRIHARLERPG